MFSQDIAALLEDFMKVANHSLEKVQFQIRKGYEETKCGDTYKQFYAFVPLEENEQIAKLQRNFTEPEVEFLRLIILHLIDEKSDTENNLINLCMQGGFNSAKKKLNTQEAAKTIKSFLTHGYLARLGAKGGVRAGAKGGRLVAGVRLFLELEGWLDNENNTEIEKCDSCHKPVINSVTCQIRNCSAKFHMRCVESKSKCTICKSTLKVTGVAAKR